jgi:AraC family transcriptional regulator, arabinose operon regulatory protein
MLQIPSECFRTETVHRSIGSDINRGIISCGFIHEKLNNASAEHIIFEYYGALLLLSGEGTHVDSEGREYKLTPGCFIQRIPGKPHSSFVKTDGKWLEFFICFGRGVFESLAEINVLNARQDVLYPGVNRAILDTFSNFMDMLRKCPEEELPLMLAEAQRIILTIYHMHWLNSSNQQNMELIKQACLMLGRDPTSRISAEEVSLQLGMGYEKFRKLFKDMMGISPGEYA